MLTLVVLDPEPPLPLSIVAVLDAIIAAGVALFVIVVIETEGIRMGLLVVVLLEAFALRVNAATNEKEINENLKFHILLPL